MATFGSKSTEQEEFDNNIEANMQTIRINLDKTSDPKFAKSLCDWYTRTESLTSKQAYRAMKFWQEINQQGDIEEAIRTTGRPAAYLPPQVSVDGKAMHDALLLAGTTLAFPRIKYKMENGDTLFIHLLGDKARHPGNMVVKLLQRHSEEQPKILLGERYVSSGKFVFTSDVLHHIETQVLIKKVVDSFPGELAINGRQHICCCFCGIGLHAAASLKVGYGPICAANYGLPWGEGEELVSIEDVV